MFHVSDPNGFVAVVLMDGFSSLSFGAIVEPFAYLARAYPDVAPRLILTGTDACQARSQAGVVMQCDETCEALVERLKRGRAPARVFLCGSTEGHIERSAALRSVLRVAKRNGASIYGIGNAAWLMAECGVLGGHKGTVHWSSLAAFSERFFGIEAQNALYVSTGLATSCAGETATVDLVLDVVSSISPDAALDVADRLLVSFPRAGNSCQPGSRAHRLRGAPSVISRATQVMADHIEHPLSAVCIADQCEISVRNLERLFRKYIGISPMKYYTQIRLEHAHDLVTQTDMTLLDIAIASGFASAGALTRKFRHHFAITPSQMRSKAMTGMPAEMPE